jgi:hypothetical protein
MNRIPTTLAPKVASACAFAASWCFLATDSLALEMEVPEGTYIDNLTLQMGGPEDSYADDLTLQIAEPEGTYIDNLALQTEEPEGSYAGDLTLQIAEPEGTYIDNLALQTEEPEGSYADNLALQAEESKGSYWLAASNTDLDEMRGGFDFGGGVRFSIGIERVTYINGALITATSFNFNNLNGLGPELVAQLNNQVMTLIQNGPGNIFQPGSAPATSTGTAARSTSSTAPATVALDTSSASPSSVIQNARAGTAAVMVQTIPSISPATFIQNSMNNQHISHMTVINATVNSLGMMRSMHSLSTLREALAGAIHSRW